MAPEITNACVWMALVERTVSMILTNVPQTLVKMGQPVMIMLTRIPVNVKAGFLVPTVTQMTKTVQLVPA